MIYTRMESLGSYLPKTVQSTEALIASMSVPPNFNMAEITGIKNRRVHAPEEESLDLALHAAADALSRSRYCAEDLDIVVSASISRSQYGQIATWEPCLAGAIARKLGARNAIHFDVANACAGMITGVYILDRMIKAGTIRRGLVVSGEVITPIAETAAKEITEALDPQFASLSVGDAGAAVIIDASESEADRIHYVELMTSSEYSRLCIGIPNPKSEGAALYTNNREMHRKERIQMWPLFQKDVLASRGSSFENEQYDYIIQHQVGTRAITFFTNFGGMMFSAKMPPSLSVVEELGNTASTSHFVVLHQYLKENRIKKGAKLLLVPAASGLVTGCLSTTITSLEV